MEAVAAVAAVRVDASGARPVDQRPGRRHDELARQCCDHHFLEAAAILGNALVEPATEAAAFASADPRPLLRPLL